MDENTKTQKVYSYKELIVWQKAVELSIAVYEITEHFPKEEIYGLTSQLRRAAVSIASNIAEGRHRGTRADFLQFLRIAQGSCAELQTQIEIAKQLSKMKNLNYDKIIQPSEEILKMLFVMIKRMNPRVK